MRVVVQRVKSASVDVDGETVGQIGKGLLLFVGIGPEDDDTTCTGMAKKVAGLRIFPDASGKMSRSLLDESKEVLVVSQFTLYGDCRKGRRPNFSRAAPPERAEPLYRVFLDALAKEGLHVQEGSFGAMMDVNLVNDGPVTLLLDSEGQF